MKLVVHGAVACIITILAGAMPCVAPATKAAPAVILDTGGVWRTFEVLKPPVLEFDDGIKPLTSTYAWLDRETPAPPADWTRAEFADGAWLRGSARTFSHTAYLAELCKRARFEVTDPAQVKDLKLSLSYYGGAIVYINGQEIARANLPKDGRRPAALADGYGPEAYLSEKGEMVPSGWSAENHKAAMAARERKLSDIAIPAQALRKGVNVLAIEVIRSPYHKLLADKKNQTHNDEVQNQNCPYDFTWYTCEVRQVSLTAGSAAGVVPNAGRPKDLQAWTSDLLTADTRADLGDRCQSAGPVLIKGPRNGWSSGKLVIGSPRAIEGMKAAVSDLKQGGAVIPAAQVRVRYAVPFGNRPDSPLDSLIGAPLDSFPSVDGSAVVPI
jgi:hypothetical protein